MVILKKRKSKSAHLVGAASRVRLKEVIKRGRFFFGLSWPSINIYLKKLRNEPYNSNIFLECDFLRKRKKSVANS